MRNAPFFVVALLWLVSPAGATADPVPSYRARAVINGLEGRLYPAARGRKTLTEFEAHKRLSAGQSVYVGLDTGKLRRGKLPRGFNRVFKGNRPLPSDYGRDVIKGFRVRHRVKVSSIGELMKLNATDRLTYNDTSTSLSSTERQVAGALQRFAGGVHGSWRLAASETEYFRPAHKVKVRGPKWLSRNPGLYAPDQKVGGFLGFGKQPRRLSVLEATDRIVHGQSVLIRDKTGASIVSSPDQVSTFSQLH
jgi:hypothetical protein